MSDIEGTENEKRFFHAFKLATYSGFTTHVENVTLFWNYLAPRLAHSSDAVKHATVALGASYHLYKAFETGSASIVDSHSFSTDRSYIHKLEYFINHHYNMAINKLHDDMLQNAPNVVIMALTCCLIFINIENLRSDQRAAIMHLKSGTAIIDKSFNIRQLFDSTPETYDRNDRPASSALSVNELKDVIKCFRLLEHSERLFSFEVPLIITSRLCDEARLDNDGCIPRTFRSIQEAYKAVDDFINDVMGYDYQINSQRGDSSFWSSPVVIERHDRLVRRGNEILDLYKAYLESSNAPGHGTRERASCYQDIVQLFGMQAMVDVMPVHIKAQQLHRNTMSEMLHYVEQAMLERRAWTLRMAAPIDYTIDGATLASLFYTCMYATDVDLMEHARRLLVNWTGRAGPWDGKSIAKLLEMYEGNLGKWGGDLDCCKLFQELNIRGR